MNKILTDRVKVNPPLGHMPVLQFCTPNQLRIDPAYQRDIGGKASQSLIRRIAQHWNWDLCQPLVVARRSDLTERLFVIDGQHRLEAARLRGDIPQLPCVIVELASQADEVASFVNLNQSRRPLSALELFRARVASEDREATAIDAAITAAGLTLASHSNYTARKPGMVANIGGIREAWRSEGPEKTEAALRTMALAFQGQVLRYAGTIFPGVVGVIDDIVEECGRIDEAACERLQTLLATYGQDHWRREIAISKAERPGFKWRFHSAWVLRRSWRGRAATAAPARPAPVNAAPATAGPARAVAFKPPTFPVWCSQCESRVSESAATACQSAFCKAREAA